MANTPAPAPEAAAAPVVALDVPSDPLSEAPLTSPFLPDAKPEKRPLGSPLPAEDTSPAHLKLLQAMCRL